MTNEGNESISGTGIEVPAVTDPIPSQPAPGADEQKPIPTEAEDTSEVAETTEQQEAKKQSKFQRRLDRQKSARVAAETETRLLREQLATARLMLLLPVWLRALRVALGAIWFPSQPRHEHFSAGQAYVGTLTAS